MGVEELSKKCPLCGRNKKLSSYYSHRDYSKEKSRDPICKECSRSLASSKEGMMKYCNTTSRRFDEVLWKWAEDKITLKFKEDIEYNSLSEDKKKKILNEKIVSAYFGQMNQVNWYAFVPDKSVDMKELKADLEDEEYDNTPVKKRKERKTYSAKWGGDFTSEEIIYLEDQYKKAQDQYDLKTGNDFEYAMNVAVAGLIVRKNRNGYLNGENGADKRYKEAVAIYDSLCTSSKFNQKTRSTNDTAGLGSLSEIVARLEQSGFLQKKIIFDDDHIEKVNADLRHVLSSVGGDS